MGIICILRLVGLGGPWICRPCPATDAFLVGQAIQRATCTPVDEYTERKILSPLGIEHWQWSYSPTHEVMTGGGLQLRARDLATIAWMMTDEGRWNGRQVVASQWTDKALTVRRASRHKQNYEYFIFDEDYSTAYGGQHVWYMAGNGGSQILILRELGAAALAGSTHSRMIESSARSPPDGAGGCITGHDGESYPAFNTTARIIPSNGDGIIVLETEAHTLASAFGGAWTYWQTGTVPVDALVLFDAQVIKLQFASAALAIACVSALLGWLAWRRKKAVTPMSDQPLSGVP
jgi:CubicO group peptidase (beta-lactamase class C family)